MKKIAFNRKTVKLGSYSLIVTAVVIAIVVIANLSVGLLPSRMTKYSVMANDVYEIDESGKQIVQNVKDDVTVYIVCTSDALDLQENAIAEEYIIRYTELNSKIKYKRIDPVVSPEFVSGYTDEKLDSSYVNAIVVNNTNGRSRVITNSEIYYKQYSDYVAYYYQIENPTYFGCEQALVSAIDYVTMAKLPTVYYTSGHGEVALGETVSKLIDSENITLKELSLTAGSVPSDADVIFIGTPTKDFTDSEIASLSEYAKKGGSVVLCTYYNSKIGNLSNLFGFAAEYGLSYSDCMVFEGSSSNSYSAEGYAYMFPVIAENSYSEKISNERIIMAQCHPITVNAPDGVTVTELLTTTVKGYTKSDIGGTESYAKQDGDPEGMFCVAADAEKDNFHLVWFTSPLIYNESTAGQFANLTYFMSVIDGLCAKENNVSLAAKPLQVEAMQASDGAANRWGVVLIGVIPVAVLASGFVVWRRRARR